MSHRGIGRPVNPVVLNDSERLFLQGVINAGHVGKRARVRCRAILLCAEGLSNRQVGERLGISDNGVSILRGRFLKSRALGQSNTVVERPRNARNGEISAATRRWAYGSRGKSANPVQLTREERFALENCLRDLNTTSAIAARCRIILLCADGLSNRAIAKELGLSSNTVGDWRARFAKDRIDGLLDKRKANRGFRLTHRLGGPAIHLVRDGRGGTPPAVVLDEDERLSLKSLTLGLRGTGARSDRCRMILRCADGLTDEEVAADLGVGRVTVDRWQQCFLEDGIWGLLSRPWLGLGPPLTGEQAAEVIDRSLNATPVDAPRWTAQGMAAATGLSTTTVQRIWSALGVYPRPWKMLELSRNPCSWRACAVSPGSICSRRFAQWCSVSRTGGTRAPTTRKTKRTRPRTSTARNRPHRPRRRSRAPATTGFWGPARSSSPSTPPRASTPPRSSRDSTPKSPRVLAGDRPKGLQRPEPASRGGPQHRVREREDRELVDRATALAGPRRADLRRVGPSGRTLVRRTDAQAVRARRDRSHSSPHRRYPRFRRTALPFAHAFRMAWVRLPQSRRRRALRTGHRANPCCERPAAVEEA